MRIKQIPLVLTAITLALFSTNGCSGTDDDPEKFRRDGPTSATSSSGSPEKGTDPKGLAQESGEPEADDEESAGDSKSKKATSKAKNPKRVITQRSCDHLKVKPKSSVEPFTGVGWQDIQGKLWYIHDPVLISPLLVQVSPHLQKCSDGSPPVRLFIAEDKEGEIIWGKICQEVRHSVIVAEGEHLPEILGYYEISKRDSNFCFCPNKDRKSCTWMEEPLLELPPGVSEKTIVGIDPFALKEAVEIKHCSPKNRPKRPIEPFLIEGWQCLGNDCDWFVNNSKDKPPSTPVCANGTPPIRTFHTEDGEDRKFFGWVCAWTKSAIETLDMQNPRAPEPLVGSYEVSERVGSNCLCLEDEGNTTCSWPKELPLSDLLPPSLRTEE